jgi:ribA/ribD-fused uncharacterized protein
LNASAAPCDGSVAGWPEAVLVDQVVSGVSNVSGRCSRSQCLTFYDPAAENGILSNPGATTITLDGMPWSSIEAIYQAMKHWSDHDVREAIRCAPDGLKAKQVAKRNGHLMRPECRDAFMRDKTRIMAGAMILRAAQDPAYREFLTSTGDVRLVEATPAHAPDPHWGMVGNDVLTGINLAGQLLEGLRAALAANVITD